MCNADRCRHLLGGIELVVGVSRRCSGGAVPIPLHDVRPEVTWLVNVARRLCLLLPLSSCGLKLIDLL